MQKYLLWCVQLAGLSQCDVIASDLMNEEECKGSVTLYEGSKETVVTKHENVKVTIDKVKVEGCGCFKLHSRKEGKGKSFFLGRRGEFSAEDIGWRKVRSVWKVECWSMKSELDSGSSRSILESTIYVMWISILLTNCIFNS